MYVSVYVCVCIYIYIYMINYTVSYVLYASITMVR